MELGLGAGWKRDEWRAYGYGFPDAPERLAILRDTLEVARAMMTDDAAGHCGGPAPADRLRGHRGRHPS
jgi:alkanesulfonate monooxygenase SsuD/methylene tetrahydromethanopterin reductase-like flavin-dependent oxidoreductase (luciferase family)